MPDERRSADLPSQPDAAGWHVQTGLSLHEMERFLDWLEQCGCTCREVSVDVGGNTVRWRNNGERGRSS